MILFLAIGFIIIVTAIAYYPCLENGFVWDDEGYILKNYYIKNISMGNLKVILTTPIMGNYHPLVIISYAWEYFFFKLNPVPYHTVNMIIHLLNCVVVFFFILRLSHSTPVAFITGLLFGIHPLHVESVAWISERKDVLYTFFYLISLACYLTYIEKKTNYKYYFFTLFFFLLSLLSKPMAVTLPLILFLMDYIRDKKITFHSMIEKVPFFIFSILSSVVTLFAQKLSENYDSVFAFPKSILVACYGLVFYLYKTVLPIKLAALYRYPLDNDLSAHIQYIIAPLIVLVLALFVLYSTKYTKKAVWGGLFYFITLLPVIQFLPIGFAVASDRYTYVPLIGIFYAFSELLVWAWCNKLSKHQYVKTSIIIISFMVTTYLIFLTNNSCKVWKDNISLWTNVIKYYPQTDVAYNNRGSEYLKLNKYDKALDDFYTTIQLNPQHAYAHSNVCNVYFANNESEKALPYCIAALKINPAHSNTYGLLGDIYWLKNKLLSIEMYKKSISLSPNHTSYVRLCNAYLELQKYDDAYPICFDAVTYNPDDVVFCNNTANSYLEAKQYNRALSFYLRALSINYNLPEVHNNLAVLYYYLNDYASASKHFNTAISLGHKVNPEFKKLIEKRQQELSGLKNDRNKN